MGDSRRMPGWMQVVLLLLVAMPLFLLLMLPAGTGFALWLWVVVISFVVVWLVWMILLGSRAAGNDSEPGGGGRDRRPRMLHPEEHPAVVRDLMEVRLAVEQEGVQSFRGPLRDEPHATYRRLREALPEDIVPMVQADEQLGANIVLMPRPVEEATMERPVRPWIHWLLFGLTFLTTTWAGALHQGVNLLEEPQRFGVGLPYSLALLMILGFHELGHYFTARYHGIHVTPPYFIPVPFALGTFGAFIQMRSPTEHRQALFDVAVAGPLAGLVVAVPALMIGLQNSAVVPAEPAPLTELWRGTSVESSLMFAFLSRLAIGEELQFGCLVRLSPLAFAGWLGLLVTALNLLPVGQLDGGHMARAMFGRRIGETISTVAMWSLFLLALFVWPALLFWAIIVFFIAGRRGPPPLNDLSPITTGRTWLGYATFALLVAILAPVPRAMQEAIGIYCPYL